MVNVGFASRDDGTGVSRELRALRQWPRTIRYALGAIAVALVALVGWAIGRSGRTSTSSDALISIEAKQREHETRLASLQHEIADAEIGAAEARRHAALERCHADAERIDASVAARAADCVREQATVSACHAQNEMAQGKSMQEGCAVGLLAAVFTGVPTRAERGGLGGNVPG